MWERREEEERKRDVIGNTGRMRMLNRDEIIRDVEKYKIIVILRGFNREQLIRTVAAMEKGPRDYQVTVNFDTAGQRVMYAQFAKLKKI